MKPVYVDGVGLLAPGLPGWAESLPVLRGAVAYVAQPVARPAAGLLPANERRRCGDTTRLAVHVAHAAAQAAACALDTLHSVFASSEGDGKVLHDNCTALAAPARAISPTSFHNSVHNAAAGYWSIAAASRAPSTSLAAYDGTFAAGLLEAAVQVLSEDAAVLLVVYGSGYPEPLCQVRPTIAPCAVALVLRGTRGAHSLAELEIALTPSAPETQLADSGLERLRAGSPAMRALPVLERIARAAAGTSVLPYVDGGMLEVALRPCR